MNPNNNQNQSPRPVETAELLRQISTLSSQRRRSLSEAYRRFRNLGESLGTGFAWTDGEEQRRGDSQDLGYAEQRQALAITQARRKAYKLFLTYGRSYDGYEGWTEEQLMQQRDQCEAQAGSLMMYHPAFKQGLATRLLGYGPEILRYDLCAVDDWFRRAVESEQVRCPHDVDYLRNVINEARWEWRRNSGIQTPNEEKVAGILKRLDERFSRAQELRAKSFDWVEQNGATVKIIELGLALQRANVIAADNIVPMIMEMGAFYGVPINEDNVRKNLSQMKRRKKDKTPFLHKLQQAVEDYLSREITE